MCKVRRGSRESISESQNGVIILHSFSTLFKRSAPKSVDIFGVSKIARIFVDINPERFMNV